MKVNSRDSWDGIVDLDNTLHTSFKKGLKSIKNNSHTGYFLTGGDCNFKKLLTALGKNKCLKELFLRGIYLSQQEFVGVIKSAKHLKRLDLCNSSVRNFDPKEIGAVLNESSITKLNLTLDNITEEQVKLILEQLNETRRKETSIDFRAKTITLL